jgi:hypothetical protein
MMRNFLLILMSLTLTSLVSWAGADSKALSWQPRPGLKGADLVRAFQGSSSQIPQKYAQAAVRELYVSKDTLRFRINNIPFCIHWLGKDDELFQLNAMSFSKQDMKNEKTFTQAFQQKMGLSRRATASIDLTTFELTDFSLGRDEDSSQGDTLTFGTESNIDTLGSFGILNGTPFADRAEMNYQLATGESFTALTRFAFGFTNNLFSQLAPVLGGSAMGLNFLSAGAMELGRPAPPGHL